MGELKSSGKSFEISKQEVWKAFQRVKANKGAPGVDEVTLEEFESDLKNISIGSGTGCLGQLLPSPVRAVAIPKPMVEAPGFSEYQLSPTGWRRRSWRGGSRRRSSRSSTPTPMAIDRSARPSMRCGVPGAAGDMLVVDLDVEKFFDSVPWISSSKRWRRTSPSVVLLYIKRWLAARCNSPTGR